MGGNIIKIFFAIIFICLCIFIVNLIVNYIVRIYINANSLAIKKIKNLNENYLPNVVLKNNMRIQQRTLQKFKIYNAKKDFIEMLNENYIKSTLYKFQKDNFTPEFMAENHIKGAYVIFAKKICATEKKMYHSLYQSVRMISYYTSPKGKNHYETVYSLSVEGVYQLYKEVVEERAKVDARKQERAKLTPSIRYDVLRRDGYKCQICGATKDDSKLHVDHIKPVSKGGKTEMSNLRTLCEYCNLGKSDKFDPNLRN